MMRGLLVYWQCPRHVMSLGGYPERIPPWLAVLPLPCCVPPLLHSHVSTATSWTGPGTATHSFRLSAQELRHSSLTSVMKGHSRGQGKSRIKQQSQNVRLDFCTAQTLQISSRSLLQKGGCCLNSLEAVDYSDFCKPHWDLQDATRLWDTRIVEIGLRKRDLVDICLHPRNLLSCPQIWMGWSTLDSPCVSPHYNLSSQKVKMLCPPKEGRQPNPSPDTTQ